MKKKLIKWLRVETVLSVAMVLALLSCILVPPDKKYLEYVDCQTILLLFCLMIVVAGFSELGIFTQAGNGLLLHIRTERGLVMTLVALCFFSSMFVTNDVALITFVPLGFLILQIAGLENRVLLTVTLMTVSANLGSMLTPIGNPQNLYLYTISKMSLPRFVWITMPYALVSAAALFIVIILLFRGTPVQSKYQEKQQKIDKVIFIWYLIQFVLCLLTVVKVLSIWVLFAIIVCATLVKNYRLLRQVDYSLLLTFIFFFIFIGNIGRFAAFRTFVQSLVEGQERIVSIGISQIISNVPAAILLADFTHNWKELIIGVNLGGLGTLIASMASLISYKQIAKQNPDRKKTYLGVFTLVNILFLLLFGVIQIIGK